MEIFDIIVCCIIAYFAYKGFKNGLIKELANIVALFAGVFAAIRFSDFLSSILSESAKIAKQYVPILSFLIIFITVVILIFVFSNIFDKILNKIKLKWLNILGGILFSILKISIILGGLFYVFNKLNNNMNFLSQDILNSSYTFNILLKVFDFIFPYAQTFKEFPSF